MGNPFSLVYVGVCLCASRGWLERESRHGLQPGQNWFLISMQWWKLWKDYVRYVSEMAMLWIVRLAKNSTLKLIRHTRSTSVIEFAFCFKDNKCIVVEQPSVLGSGRRTHQSISAEPALSKTGTVARSLSSPGEKSPKSNWEVSECTSNSKCVFQWSYTA